MYKIVRDDRVFILSHMTERGVPAPVRIDELKNDGRHGLGWAIDLQSARQCVWNALGGGDTPLITSDEMIEISEL